MIWELMVYPSIFPNQQNAMGLQIVKMQVMKWNVTMILIFIAKNPLSHLLFYEIK